MSDPTLPREGDPVEAALDALSMKAAVERGGTRDAAMQAIGIDLAVHEIRAAIRSRPVEEGDRHPDDGHAHSFGCRLCGVDAPARPVEVDPERLAILRRFWSVPTMQGTDGHRWVRRDSVSAAIQDLPDPAFSSPEPRKP